jgi:hypothetical protein
MPVEDFRGISETPCPTPFDALKPTDSRRVSSIHAYLVAIMPVMIERSLAGWPTAETFFEMIDHLNVARFMTSVRIYNEAFKIIRVLCRCWDLPVFYFGSFATMVMNVRCTER